MTEPPRSTSGSWREPDAPASQAPWWVAGQGGAWPTVPTPPAPPEGPNPPGRRTGRIVGTAGLGVFVLVGSLLLFGGSDEEPGTASISAPSSHAALTPPSELPSASRTRLKALPAPVPGKGGYALLAYSRKAGDARWDPCKPIHYVTRLKDAPAGSTALVGKAFAQLSAATGLVFVDDGSTTEAPDEDRDPRAPGNGTPYAPVLLSWSNAREAKVLKGNVDGAARADALDPDGRGLRLVSGQVTLDAPAFRGYSSSFRLEIVLHELGHLVGLDHVSGDDDIMFSESDGIRPKTRYTPGALRGLRVAGQGACFP